MKSFIQKHAADVIGVLSGFDRLVFRGTLRTLSYVEGMGASPFKVTFSSIQLVTVQSTRECSSRVEFSLARASSDHADGA